MQTSTKNHVGLRWTDGGRPSHLWGRTGTHVSDGWTRMDDRIEGWLRQTGLQVFSSRPLGHCIVSKLQGCWRSLFVCKCLNRDCCRSSFGQPFPMFREHNSTKPSLRLPGHGLYFHQDNGAQLASISIHRDPQIDFTFIKQKPLPQVKLG